MCGIAGIVTADGNAIDRGHLASMIAMLQHRGPDDRGMHVDQGAGLAHARLSVVDLAGGKRHTRGVSAGIGVAVTPSEMADTLLKMM